MAKLIKKLGLLKPGHPESRAEWEVKILVAFVLALVVLFGNIDTGMEGAWGAYAPGTDEIWVDPALNEYETMIVTVHEEAHRAFFHLLPFWSLVKISVLFLSLLALFLGVLTVSKRLWLVAGCLLFVAGLAEIHAYGITLLMFGPSDCIWPGLSFYVGVPLALCAAGLWIFR